MPSTTSAPQADRAAASKPSGPPERMLLWLMDFYEKTYFYNIRATRKLLPTGKALLAFGAAAFLLIWDPSKIGMRYGFTLCLACFACAILANWIRQPRSLDIARSLPERAVEGELFEYEVTAVNRGRRTTPAIRCRDHGRLRFPTLRDFQRAKAPFESELNGFDRWLGYPKWMWLVETMQDVIGSDFEIPPLAPGQTFAFRATGRAGRRGKRLFLGFYCGVSDPFGLLQRLFYVKARQSLLCLPKPLMCGVSVPAGSRSMSAGDSRDLRKTGDSEEFRSLREWRSGDPLKRIDWKATARFGAPIAREFAPEYKLRTALAFDTSLPEGVDEQAFEDAMGYAAGLVVSIDRKDRNIDLLVLEDHVVTLRLGAGSLDHVLALEKLASCSPSGLGSLRALEESILSSAAHFTSAVLICPWWGAEHSAMARRIAARGIGLAIVVCSTPADPDFPPSAQVRLMAEAHQ